MKWNGQYDPWKGNEVAKYLNNQLGFVSKLSITLPVNHE